MTDDLAEVKRHIEPAPNLAASVVPESYLMAAPPFTPTPDPCAHLRAELTRLKSSQAEHDRTVRLEALEEAARIAERLPDQDCGDIVEYYFAGRQIAKAIRALTGQESGTS